MSKIGIIAVNYKDYANRFIDDFIDGLNSQTFNDFNLYIVDNDGTPSSFNFLLNKCPNATILTRTNANYCAAMNFGASAAIEDGANRLVFVNLDVKFDKDWLMELNNAMDKQQDCAMVQSKILLFNAENKRIINTIGNQIHYLGFGQTVGYKQPDCEIAELSEIKGYASGVSFMIKSEIFKRVGGYDEEYFMYHDDIELSYKTRLLKQKIYLAPKSIIYHKYEFSRSIKMLYYMERNRFLFIFQFYKLPTIVLLLPMIFCLEVGMHFYAVIGHWFRVKLNADFYFWRISTWRKIMLKRKFIKTFRKTNDKEMFRSFNSQIQFAEIENSVLKYLGNPLMKIFAKFAKMIIFW